MFGSRLLRNRTSLLPFVTNQLPLLQNAAERKYEGIGFDDSAKKCPECSTVSQMGIFIRRCMNPRCAAEFCANCEGVLDGCSSRSMLDQHANKQCVAISRETAKISAGEGLSSCPRCSTPIWHATSHGCHAVKCPNCSLRFCHACGTPYDPTREHTPRCSCPIFCRSSFACKCAKSCPECSIAKCAHCDGTCHSCVERQSSRMAVASLLEPVDDDDMTAPE